MATLFYITIFYCIGGCNMAMIPARLPITLLLASTGLLLSISAAENEPAYLQVNAGLNDQERALFYHLPEGSEIFPLKWLRALNSARTGQPFLANIERFGLLPDDNNPDALPIGMTA